MSDLALCKECGGSPVFKRERSNTKPKITCWFECAECGAHGYGLDGTRKKALETWNYEQQWKSPLASDNKNIKGGNIDMPESSAGTRKEAEAKRRKKTEKAAEKTVKVEKEKLDTEPAEMTPRDAVDLLYDTPYNAEGLEASKPKSGSEASGATQADLSPEASAPEPKPKTPYVSPKDEARSSREATAAMANPVNVASIREQLGEFYAVEDVAAALGVTTRTVLQKLRDGALKGVKIGGGWRISINALRRFMEAD